MEGDVITLLDMSELAAKICIHSDPKVDLPHKKEQDQKWIALLVDGDCLTKNPYVVLAEALQLGEVVIRRIYASYNSKARHIPWEHLHTRYNFERRLLLGVHKNLTDMAIIAEAVELALTIPELDTFVIATNDGGYFPLMNKLVELGKTVYWLGGEQACEKVEKLSSAVKQGLKTKGLGMQQQLR